MKKPHYYYKVSAESNVGRDIQAFMTRCQEAEEQALEWAKNREWNTIMSHRKAWLVEWEP